MIVILVAAEDVGAPSALDGFDPNPNDLVEAVIVQQDGKVLIGGHFTTVLGVTRNYIARLAITFRADINFNGVINATDVSLVKSYLGTGLP